MIKPFFVHISDNYSYNFIFEFIKLLKKYKHRLFDDENSFKDIKSLHDFILSLNGFLWFVIDPVKFKLAGFIFLMVGGEMAMVLTLRHVLTSHILVSLFAKQEKL